MLDAILVRAFAGQLAKEITKTAPDALQHPQGMFVFLQLVKVCPISTTTHGTVLLDSLLAIGRAMN